MTEIDPRGRFELIGIGECMVEFHAAIALGDAPTLTRSFGGDVLNTLVHAARSGLGTAFMTRVGDDPFGDYLLRAWREENVDTSHALRVEGVNGVYFISVDDNGEREFTYRRAGSAAAGMCVGDVDESFLHRASALFFSGITQAISDSAAAVVERAAATVGDGVTVCYDPNYRPALWQARGGVDGARSAYHSAAAASSWMLPSYPADLPLIGDRRLEPLAALRRFACDCPYVAMKMGEEGVFLSVDGQELDIAPAEEASVVDTTGAGDAWNGAFLARALDDVPASEAAQAANAYAATTLAYRGAIPPRSD